MTSRLYVVTRSDLSPGQQAVQACHAALLLAGGTAADFGNSTLVLLTVPDENGLLALASRIERHCALPRGWNLELAIFREPDLGGQATALATSEEDAGRLLRDLPLALTPCFHAKTC